MVWWTECRCERSLDVVERTPFEARVDSTEHEKQCTDSPERSPRGVTPRLLDASSEHAGCRSDDIRRKMWCQQGSQLRLQVTGELPQEGFRW